MCGGRGTRLGSSEDGIATEKPLVEVRGVAMIDRVIDALCGSRVGTVYAVTSPHVPETRVHLTTSLDGDAGTSASDRPDAKDDPTAMRIIDAPGEGYVPDLGYALDRVSPPMLTVACDLPLLAPVIVDRVLARFPTSQGSLAAYVPAALKRQLGVSVDSTWSRDERELAPTGLNVVAGEQGTTAETERDDRSMGATGSDDGEKSRDTAYVSYDARLAVNVNRPSDLTVAEALCE
jgi:adenosylcobinamide-phosphate guanylyltransferase